MLPQPIRPHIIYSQRDANHRCRQHERCVDPIATLIPALGLFSRVDPYTQDQAQYTDGDVEGHGKAGGSGRMGVRCEKGKETREDSTDRRGGDNEANVAGLRHCQQGTFRWILAKARRLRLEDDRNPRPSRLTYHVGLRGHSRGGNEACCTDESTSCCVEGTTMSSDVVSKESNFTVPGTIGHSTYELKRSADQDTVRATNHATAYGGIVINCAFSDV